MDKCKHGFDYACLICGFTHIDGKKVWFDWAWQEQQKRIDELQLKISEDSRILYNVIDIENNKYRELQARLDEVVKWVEDNKKSIPLSEWHGYTTEEYVDADDLLDILKIEQGFEGVEV